MRHLILAAFFCIVPLTAVKAQTDFCDSLKNLGYLYESKDGPINLVKAYGMAQFQVGYINGTDSAGNSFSDSQHEFRRIWLGGDLRFLDGFLFKNTFSVTQGKNAATGSQKIDFKHFRNLHVLVDFAKLKTATGDWKRLEFGYGRRSLKLADEWQKSATHFDPVERSPFSNKLWPTDEGGSHPAGIWMRAARGQNDVQFGVFSTTQDDEFPGWEDGTLLYGEWSHKLAEKTGWKLRQLVFNGFTQGTSAGDQQLARGLEWGGSAILRLHRGAWEFNSTLGGGKNGESSRSSREGSFWGVTFMPMYWLVENKVKLVTRYQLQHASNGQGIRLNSRYARSADARGAADLSFTGGRGDRHHNLYLGIDYLFCGDNLKLVSGIEYDDIKSNGRNVFRGWTASSALRAYF